MSDASGTIVTDDATATTDTTTDTTATTATTGATTTDTADGQTTGDTTTTTTTPADWRSELSAGDPELEKFLGRYHSRDAALKGFRETYGQIRSGKFIKPINENSTDEEIAAFRKQLGVPETADGYFEKLPDGLVVGEDDKPYVSKFMEKMHGANAPPAVASAALEAYYGILEEQSAAEADALATAKTESEDALRSEWGNEYRRNLTIMHSHLATLPEPVRDAFTHGFGKDGVPLGYNPEVLKWLTGLALEANPVATVVPGAGGNQMSAIVDEMANLEKMMGDPNSDYWKGPKAPQLQARYVELVEARQKLGK